MQNVRMVCLAVGEYTLLCNTSFSFHTQVINLQNYVQRFTNVSRVPYLWNFGESI
jgi:hypothetical protein